MVLTVNSVEVQRRDAEQSQMAFCRVEHQGGDDLSEVKAAERIVACMKNYEKKQCLADSSTA